MKRSMLAVNGIHLAVIDFGGSGPGLLLLHGLMGRATTWETTAAWLTPHYHVVALDQRGHGWSDHPEDDYSRTAYVDDAAAAIQALGLGPAVVVGHSMGGLNAWVLAVRRPELVRAIVIEDMTANTPGMSDVEGWRQWFESWPVPFSSLAAVRSFFAAERPAWADYFMEVMVERADGYRPIFSFEHMLRSVQDWQGRDYWAEIEQVACPALVVRGAEGSMPRPELEQMAARMPQGRFVEVSGAGHVVHYDQPAGWRAAVEPFLLEL